MSDVIEMTRPSNTIDRETWQSLAVLSILWGGAFVFIGLALHELPPLTVVLARVALGALFLLPALKMMGGSLPNTLAGWWPFFVMALLNNVVPFSLLNIGQTYISSSLTSVLNATTPLFSVLILGFTGDETLSLRRLAGVLLGVAGVFILRGGGDAHAQTIGILLCLGAALSYGFSGLWGRRKLNGVPPVTSAACQLISSSTVMLVLASAIDRPWSLPMPGPTTWLALIGLASFGTALAYLVFFRLLSRSGATNTMLVTLLIPVTTFVLGHFLLAEALTAREIAGALTIGSALLVIDGRALQWLWRVAAGEQRA